MKINKKSKSNPNKFKFWITVLSLLSLIPFGILLYHLYQLQLIATTEKENEPLVNLVLDRTISSPLIMSGFVIGLVIWISNSVISSIAVHKKILPSWFGYLTLILGGLGSHAIALFFRYISNKIKPSSKQVKRISREKSILSISFLVIFIGAITSFFALSLSLKNYDSAVLGAPVQFSTVEDDPNVIEIFTDGFDQWNKEDYSKDQDFKDFNWFSKFQTVGSATHRSVPSIWGDAKEMNPFKIREQHNDASGDDLSTIVYGESFLNAGIKHMAAYKDDFSQRSIINPICLSDDSGYSPSTSGVPAAIKKLDKDLNVTNWSGARDYNAGKFGVSNMSPDNNSYKYFSDSSKVENQLKDKSQNKGAYVLFNDLITHKPYMSSASGQLTTFNTSAQDQKTALRNNLKNLFAKLKSKKDDSGNRSAYDNSMIIIYGDHSNHYRKLRDKGGEITKYRHCESAMMVKYPNETNNVDSNMNIVDDRVIYSASINNIIKHFVDVKNDPTKYDASSQLEWIEKDHQFDRNIPRPSFYDDNHFLMTTWAGDGQGHDILTPISPKVEYTYEQWKVIAGTAADPLEGMVS